MTTGAPGEERRQRLEGEWTVEIPDCRDALEMLREAANDPATTDEEFDVLADHVFRAGFFPDRLHRPGEEGGYTRDCIVHLIGLGGNEILRDILRDSPCPQKPLPPPEQRDAPRRPHSPVAWNSAGTSVEGVDDDTEELDDEAGHCPLCGCEDCEDHLLGSFDRTFDGQGLYGAGMGGGALYNVDEIGNLLGAIRLARVVAWKNGGSSAPPPRWIQARPELADYFQALGNDGFDLSEYAGPEEAADFLPASTRGHGGEVRSLLQSLLIDCGWKDITTEDEDGAPFSSSDYTLWWDSDPQAVAHALARLIRKILKEA